MRPKVGSKNNCWFVIAAFNERSMVGGVVEEIRTLGYSVVVVDDGSSDDTAQQARLSGASVCRHGVNLGQGAALQTGIEYALAGGAEFIVTYDADGQHRIADAEAMLEVLQSQDVDVVYGSRFLASNDHTIPQIRRLVLRMGVLFTRLVTGLRVSDAHCGLRAFSRSAGLGLNITQNRMAHASEIPVAFKKLGLRYVEWPVTIDYTTYSRRKGQKSSGALIIVLDLIAGRAPR